MAKEIKKVPENSNSEENNSKKVEPENTMREITVTFDESKLKALEFYLKDRDITAKDELQNYLSTMFMRAVPAEVRRFNFPESDEELQDMAALFATPESKQVSRGGRTPEQKEALNAKRREERRLAKLSGEQGQNPTQPGQEALAGGPGTMENSGETTVRPLSLIQQQ